MAATSVEAECEREPPAKRSKAVDAQSAAAAAEDDDGDAEIAIELDDSADVDASPNAGASPPALTAHMLEEEASLAEARAAEDAALHRAQAAEHKAISKPAIAAKVRRLNELLEKSIVYSVTRISPRAARRARAAPHCHCLLYTSPSPRD